MSKVGLCLAAMLAVVGSWTEARAATLSWVYSYPGVGSAAYVPNGPVAIGADGTLWTTASNGPTAAGAVFNFTTTGKIRHQINGDCVTFLPLGCVINGGLAVGPDGTVYGTAYVGTHDSKGESRSAVFRINPNGYPFHYTYLDPSKIGLTLSGLTYRSGALYGINNGAYGAPGGSRGGPSSVFRIALTNKASTVIPGPSDGLAMAYVSVAFDAQGNIWAPAPGDDVILNSGGVFIVAHSYVIAAAKWQYSLTFNDRGDTGICNLGPVGKPYIAADGSVVVAAQVNPNTTCFGHSGGLILKRPPGGGQAVVLGGFTASTQGLPAGGVVADAHGALYGSTTSISQGPSIVYCITPSGKLVTLATFASANNGADVGELTPDGLGSFYGATASGGAHGYGGIFKLTPGTTCQ